MIGKALRLIRVFNDFKAYDLANKLEISPSYLSEIESGKKHPPLDLIYRYAVFFSMKPSSILFFSEELDRNGSKKVIPDSRISKKLKGQLIKFLQSVENAKG